MVGQRCIMGVLVVTGWVSTHIKEGIKTLSLKSGKVFFFSSELLELKTDQSSQTQQCFNAS